MALLLPISLWLSASGVNPTAWILPGASLDLDFVHNRAFTKTGGKVLPSSLLTTVRASTGYAQTSSGSLTLFQANTPRITDLGLLVEQAATNLALQSQALTNAAWKVAAGGVGGVPTVTANQAAAPDGTVTATRVQFALNGGTTSADLSAINQNSNITTTNTSTYTFSVWMKSNTASTYTIYLEDAPTGLRQSATVTPTWTRFSLVYVASASSNPTINLWGGQTPASSNSADLLVWGAQLELGSFPTSYIPTTTVAVTRAADSIKATVNITAPYTAFISMGGLPSISGLDLVAWGSLANGAGISATGGTADAFVRESSVTTADPSAGTITANAAFKVAARYAVNNVNISATGGIGTNDTSVTPLTMTTIGFGPAQVAFRGGVPNGFIKRFAIFSSGLSDAQIQALTT